MNRNTFAMRCVSVTALMVGTAAAAAAQQATAGPYGDLFGTSRKPQTQSLDIRAGLFGGYDDNVLAQTPNSGATNLFDPRLQVPGVTTGFSSTATYGYVHTGRGRSGTQFHFGGAATVQEFNGADSKPLWAQNYGADTSLGTNLTPKVSVSLNGTASYAPYYQYLPFLGNGSTSSSAISDIGAALASPASDAGASVTPPPVVLAPANFSPVGSDVGFASQSAFVQSWGAGASITDRFSKRTSVSGDVRWDETLVSGLSRIETRTASARIAHRLTRKLGLHLGFGLQDAQYIQGPSPTNRTLNQLFDFGVDYGDGLVIARRYTLTFSTGTSALRQGSETQFRLDGNAALARRIGRTWSASIGAARGTSYILGFSSPFFSDSANAGFGGQLAPRVNVSAGATYLRGQNAFSASASRLVSESASAKATFALTSHVGLYAQYSYYQYDVPDGFFSTPTLALPQHLRRRSASVGVSLWVPVINQRAARQP